MKKQMTWLSIIILLLVTIVSSLASPTVRAAGGPNLTAGKTATSSSSNGSYKAAGAFDGKQETYWESASNSFPQWIQVDLGSTTSIDQVVMKLPAGWETRTQTLSVQGSSNGSNFSDLVGSKGYVFTPTSNNTVTVSFNKASARYVRLNVTTNTAWPAAQISELEVYGASDEVVAAIPGKIEAENWTAMSGVQTQATTDSGGGLNVGWIHTGDWMDYKVNVQKAGTYNVEFRVASITSTGKLQLRSGNTVLATTSVPNTNGWQNWQTVSANVTLSTGEQTLRLYASGNDFNINWINFTPASVNPAPGRGASLPYTRYDTGDATHGAGAILKTAPTFNQAITASEASGQSYTALPSTGSYLEWTVREGEGGAGVTMRFTMPDSSDGMGLNGSIDVYVNGNKSKTVPLTSYYSWQYFSGDNPADNPGGGRPLFRFDEVHWILDTPLKPGDKIRIQKAADSIEYGVDFIEIEPVPAAISRPANSVSVTDFGAVANDSLDDLKAFKAAVDAAKANGKILYIPTGTFNLSNMWVVGSPTDMIDNLKIMGAGIWHTNLKFTNPNAASGGISLQIAGQLDFSHVYMNSSLRSRYNQQAVYKGFMDNFGTNSKIHNVWLEHFETGIWVGDYAHTPAIIANGLVIENSRIRNNLADGVNFAQGTSNSTVRNSSLRNNGDDALAVWTSDVNGAPAGVNNTFTYNTIENNWRAAAIAFFGGSGHQATHNLIIDTVGGSGIRMNTVFPGYHFQNNTGIVFSDTTIIRSGTSQDLYNGERGAIDLEASTNPIRNVTFNNIDIIDAQRDGIQFGYNGGFDNIKFNNITIDGTGLDGVTTSRFSGQHLGAAIYSYTNNGSATFNNLTTRNIAYPNLYFILNGFNLIK